MSQPPADVNQPRYKIIGLDDPSARMRCDARYIIGLLERIPPGKCVTLPVNSVLHLIYSGDPE